MKIVNIILFFVAQFFSYLPAKAFDLVVIFKITETNEKIPNFEGLLACTPQFQLISRAIENKNDTTYRFNGLPNVELLIGCELDGSFWSEVIKTPIDTLVFDLPLDVAPHTVNLSEVEVKSDNQYLTDKKDVFLPAKRVKRMSSSGSSLLRNMAIPSLYVSPIDKTVTTAGGEAVSMYIDYRKVSQTSVDNLNTADVVRIEVLDNPSDPRFNGDRHVVNFVMVKYEYGGYARLEGEQWFISNRGQYGAYSKMSVKDMIYEMGISDNYNKTSHRYIDRFSTYVFSDETITHNSETDLSKQSSNDFNVFFKGSYANKTMTVDNTVGFVFTRAPHNYSKMSEFFSSEDYISGKTESESRMETTGFSWDGSYHFNLTPDWRLSLTPFVSYTKYKNWYEYNWKESKIVNDNQDNAWVTRLYANITKRFGENSLSLTLNGGMTGNNMIYGGTNQDEIKGRNYDGGARLQGAVRFGKFSSYPSISIYYLKQEIGDYSVGRWLPKYYLPLSFMINGKQRLNFSSEFYYGSIPLSYMAPNRQLQNQILAITGNPKLNLTHSIDNRVSFYYLVTRNISINPAVSYFHQTRGITYSYEPVEDDDKRLMIRNIHNGGVSNNWIINLPISFVSNSQNLTARIAPRYYFINENGVMGLRKNYLNFTSQLTYSLSNFYFTGNYQTRSYGINRSEHSYLRQFYSFGVGWSDGRLNISAETYCPFSSSYRCGYKNINTPNYRSHAINYSPMYHRSFNLNISYIFSYGKKINRNTESKHPEKAESALLK